MGRAKIQGIARIQGIVGPQGTVDVGDGSSGNTADDVGGRQSRVVLEMGDVSGAKREAIKTMKQISPIAWPGAARDGGR